VDIASMACSLETRPPFLDHRLVELVASLPATAKVNGGQTKAIMRTAVADLLPADVLDHRKTGFALPMRRWMREGELLNLATDVLQDQTFRQRGLFEPSALDDLLTEHRDGPGNHHHLLYQLLVFELWARNVLDAPSPRPER
jgi:asparagine synthase (glutamine-hydrolysing)